MSVKISSLIVASLYFIFSCLYVTRCPGTNCSSSTETHCSFKNSITKLNTYTVSKHKSAKALPIAFLSRPRVIFSKNIVVLLKAHIVSLSTGLLRSVCYKYNLRNLCFGTKALHSDKIFSILRSWRI
ncbi:hypothetical protein FHS10_001330 [Mucilaginibacter dorajii]|nr:hypothetical protein [Mucilaginibacter dorajii]